MITFARRLLNALWPRGPFWEPKQDGDYDHLLDGIANNSKAVKDDLSCLACIRSPLTTPVLSDLEKDLGQVPATGATESERREHLDSFNNRSAGSGAWDVLQAQLRGAGFTDVYVTPNDPVVDPRGFIEQAFNMVCGDLLPGGNDAQCGEPEAICASTGGFLVVNGSIFSNVPNYLNLCDEADAQCGNDVYAGDFDGYRDPEEMNDYKIPTDSGYWSLIFFVSGEVTRDPVTDEITTLNTYTIPNERRKEFNRIILRYKPLFSWAALVVAYS
jgi:hypothetical protein